MRARLLAIAALLSAFPASGGSLELSSEQVDALAPIDATPAIPQIDLAFPGTSVDSLTAIATDPAQPLGVQIRALRMLPRYCPATGCATTAIHQTLATMVDGYRLQLSTAALSPQDVLRLRAAMEALGATRSGLQADVDLLTSAVLLHHPSRDVQVTDVHALRRLCSPDLCAHDTCVQDANAIRALRTGGDTQVDAAINAALQDLAPCSQP